MLFINNCIYIVPLHLHSSCYRFRYNFSGKLKSTEAWFPLLTREILGRWKIALNCSLKLNNIFLCNFAHKNTIRCNYNVRKYGMSNNILTKILWIKDKAVLHTNGVNRVFYVHYEIGEILIC